LYADADGTRHAAQRRLAEGVELVVRIGRVEFLEGVAVGREVERAGLHIGDEVAFAVGATIAAARWRAAVFGVTHTPIFEAPMRAAITAASR
jgi:hypothetical protein